MGAGAPQVEIQTSMGTFVVELYSKHAPRTTKNFLELAKRGYYDGTVVRLCSQPGARPHTLQPLFCSVADRRQHYITSSASLLLLPYLSG